MIDQLCEWMNARAAEFFRVPGKRKSNGLLRRPVGRDEMYVFLGLLMVMGINKLPRMYMYWPCDVMVGGGGSTIFCKEVMARGRFLCLLKFMRLSSPDQVKKKRASRPVWSLSLTCCANRARVY